MILGKKYAIPKLDRQGNYSETHVQHFDDILKTNNEIKTHDTQYTPEKSLKLMARIPELQFVKYGHKFMKSGIIDEKELMKWLDSEEGQHCKVNRGSAKYV